MKRKIFWRCAAVMWCTIIFLFTASPVSTGNYTQTLIEQTVHIESDVSAVMNTVIRKSGHLLAFGALAVLIYLGMKPSYRSAAAAWFAASAYGALDEWHQSFIPGRNAAWTDVALDSLGALLLLAVTIFAQRLLRRSRANHR